MRVIFKKYFTKLKSFFIRMKKSEDFTANPLDFNANIPTDVENSILNIELSETSNLECNLPFKTPTSNQSFTKKYSINNFTWNNFYIQNKEFYIGNRKFTPIYDTPLNNMNPHIYICERCVTIRNDKKSFTRHLCKCTNSTAIYTNISGRRSGKPLNLKFNYEFGVLIYEENNLKVYRIDGEIERNMCQNLCALGKCFLEDKTLFYDVEMFEFFVLFRNNNLVGYFSRQKNSINTNLSCIVVLPFYQKMGFGFFLVDFSYKIQIKKGSPERPLSDSGLAVYKLYWKYKIYQEFLRNRSLSILEISNNTRIELNDVVYGLELLGVLKNNNIRDINCPKFDFVPKLICKKQFFIQ